MKKFITLLFAGALCVGAMAQETPKTVGLHLISKHLHDSDAPGSLGWNEKNWGVYARWKSGFTAGFYRNSLFKPTVHAGWTWERHVYGPWSGAVSAEVLTGYDTMTADSRNGPLTGASIIRCDNAGCRPVQVKSTMIFALTPSVSYAISKEASLRVGIAAGPKVEPVAHLMLEYKF